MGAPSLGSRFPLRVLRFRLPRRRPVRSFSAFDLIDSAPYPIVEHVYMAQ